ncbi:MAG: CRISPR-associated CARF protein Csx1 [Desulfurococcales archaeon]|nr:CRISPR-associated CARF protein Csx1 [Desulfurococcales archaeon]
MNTRGGLLVASWGNPFSWNRVHYIIDNLKITSLTSTEAIIQARKPARVLIIGVDTFAQTSPIERNNDQKHCKGYRKLGRIDPGAFKDYQSYLDCVKCKMEAWIRLCSSIDSDTLSKLLDRGVLDVFIAPGMGSFSNVDHKGDEGINPLETLKSMVLIRILKELLRVGGPLIVDVTHGINYLTMIMHEASVTAAKIYSASTLQKLDIEILNSEPYPQPRPAKPPTLNVHRVASRTIDPIGEEGYSIINELIAVRSSLDGKRGFYIESTRLKPEDKKELGKSMGMVRREYNAIYKNGIVALNILAYTLPLALIYFAAENKGKLGNARAIDNAIDLAMRIVNGVLGRTVVTSTSILHRVAVNHGEVEKLLVLASLQDAIIQIALGNLEEIPTLEELNNRGIPLETLENIAKTINLPTTELTVHEISLIKKNVIKERRSDYIPVEEGRWPDNMPDIPNERNYKAHGGFERNTVQAMLYGEELYLRYNPAALKDNRKTWNSTWEYIKESILSGSRR